MAKKRKSYAAGMWDAFGFAGFTMEVSRLVAAMRIKESLEYKDYGYENWEEFCNEELRCSDETFRRKCKCIEDIGPQFVSISQRLGFGWKELNLIGHALTPGQKDQLKKGFLNIGEEKIPIEDGHVDTVAIKPAIDLLISRADAAIKGEKLTKSKLEGIEKEHKKELKAHQEEINSLKTLILSPDTPENFDAVFKEVEHHANQIVILAKRLKFDEAHKEVEADGPIKAKYETRIRVLEIQFNNLLDSLRESIYEK